MEAKDTVMKDKQINEFVETYWLDGSLSKEHFRIVLEFALEAGTGKREERKRWGGQRGTHLVERC